MLGHEVASRGSTRLQILYRSQKIVLLSIHGLCSIHIYTWNELKVASLCKISRLVPWSEVLFDLRVTQTVEDKTHFRGG